MARYMIEAVELSGRGGLGRLRAKRGDGGGAGTIGDLLFSGNPINGSANGDIILAQNAVTINGNDGADLILGDIGSFRSMHTGNSSFAAASDLDSNVQNWSTDENALFGDTSIPHMTVYVSAEAGIAEFFKVSVGAGETITIDIDAGASFLGSNADDQTRVELYDSSFTLLAANDEAPLANGGWGSISDYDPYLTHVAAAAGTYYIRISKWPNDLFAGGEEFLMNVSVSGHATGGSTTFHNDTIDGGTGNDQLLGAGGNDSLLGNADFDTLDGGTGADFLDGGTGDDLLYGGFFIDTVMGGDGDDTIGIRDDEFNDNVDGGLGIDTLDLSAADWFGIGANIDLTMNSFTGLGGTTTITGIEIVIGTSVSDTLTGSAGAETLHGGGGDDTLNGGDGDDTLRGGDGTDSILGGDGNDRIIVLHGELLDHVDGGAGTLDLLDLQAILADGLQHVNVQLVSGGTGSWSSLFGGTRSIAGIERVVGTEGNDTIDLGGIADAVTSGADGDDHINGGLLFQDLRGGAGNDTIHASEFLASGIGDEIRGEEGDDLLYGSHGDDTISGGTDNDTIEGGIGDDLLGGLDDQDLVRGQAGADTIVGNDGDDTLNGGVGGDALDGGDGYDMADYSGGRRVRADLLDPAANVGEATGDTYVSIEDLRGSDFADILRGDNNANILEGGLKNDALRGRGGSDTLIGGIGFDRLQGQSGADYFVLQTTASNADIIEDFVAGTDKLSLDGVLFGLTLGALDPDAFIAASSAQDAEDRLIYRAATGKLYYDPDGTGVQTQILIATLEGAPTLAATDFIVSI